MEDSLKKQTWLSLAITLFLFIILFAPFLYNTILYLSNYVAMMNGILLSTNINQILIGWKDVALLSLGFFLLYKQSDRLHILIAMFAGCAVFFMFGLDGVKQLFEPFFVLIVFMLYQPKIASVVNVHQKLILQVMLGILVCWFFIGYADYLYRITQHIQDNDEFVTKHIYLQVNNISKCVIASMKGAIKNSDDYLNCIMESRNSYKLFFDNHNYIALQALFLPVGDSVVFSILLLYFLAFYLVYNVAKQLSLNLPRFFIISFVSLSIFLTLNRVSSLFLILMILTFIYHQFKVNRSKSWTALLFITVLGAYAMNSDYLLKSVFIYDTPSNVGHMKIFNKKESAPIEIKSNKQESVEAIIKAEHEQLQRSIINNIAVELKKLLVINNLLNFLLGVTVPFLFLFYAFRFNSLVGFSYLGFFSALVVLGTQFNIPFLNFNSIAITETNFLKAITKFGLVGAAIYSFILSVLFYELLKLINSAWRAEYHDQKTIRLILILIALQFLSYQFIAPYVISGFVIFCAFLGIWLSQVKTHA